MATYADMEELIRLGAYRAGSSAEVDEAIRLHEPLEDFLRAVKGRTSLVGICFGHQIMAQAFGGRVEKSERGWGVGLQTYAMTALEPWMDSAAPIAIPTIASSLMGESSTRPGNSFARFFVALNAPPKAPTSCP